MGQVVVEIPQNVFAFFRVDDTNVGKQLLDDLKPYSRNGKRTDIIAPARHDRDEAFEEVFGIWSDREESADEIARKIRSKNRKTT